MRKKKQYKSEAFAAIHETMDSLHQIGAIDKKTMRDFDETGGSALRLVDKHGLDALSR